jgi:hypothetical protein
MASYSVYNCRNSNFSTSNLAVRIEDSSYILTSPAQDKGPVTRYMYKGRGDRLRKTSSDPVSCLHGIASLEDCVTVSQLLSSFFLGN